LRKFALQFQTHPLIFKLPPHRLAGERSSHAAGIVLPTPKQDAAPHPRDLTSTAVAGGAQHHSRANGVSNGKRGRGRPPGHPKTGGRRKKAATNGSAPDGQANGAAIPPCTCGGRYASHDPLRVDAQYSRAIADTILDRHASGETIRGICRTPGFPSDRTVRRWAYNDLDGFKARFHEAGRQFCQALDEEALEIADNRDGDWVLNPKTERMDFCHENVQRSRVRIETRQKCIARAWPERFSDRYSVSNEVTGKDGAPLIPENNASPRELARAILDIFGSAGQQAREEIDATALGGMAKTVGAPRAMFGSPASIVDAEEVADDGTPGDEAIDINDFAPGDLATVGELNIEFISGSSPATSWWWLLGQTGERVARITGLDAARAASRQLAETGKIARGGQAHPPASPSPSHKRASMSPASTDVLELFALPEQDMRPRQPTVVRSR
jgi:hypothetical protein